jgi:cell migration-inducing and hyaluronan-binding protein
VRKQNRSLLLALLVPAFLLVSVLAVVEAAQQQSSPAVSQARWSDPAAWPDRKVPVAGDKVTIAAGKEVVLDVSPPALNGLTINGKLSFANNRDVELTTEWIMVHGELEIGTEKSPHTRKATITFTNNVKDEDISGLGGNDKVDRGIMLMGGTLNLHGDRTHTWSKLSSTANAGATSIQVLDAKGWRVGDEIVLASTDFDPRQAERRTISAISGNTITLDKKLDYMHFGKITFDVDERGEVAMLTRNIRLQASADAEQSFYGGHVMAMVGSKMFVEGVEFQRMGQNLTLARYPIHWHLIGDAPGQYIKNASLHDTYNRCVTVHGTNFLRVENNVTYNTVGHCFFLEDAVEHGNEFIHNLAIQTKCHTSKACVPTNLAASGESRPAGGNGQQSKDVLLPSDNTVASYWITNPDNTYRDNVAAGSDANGFWMSLPEHGVGKFEGTEIAAKTWPRRTPFKEFNGNVAHSNYDSFMFDRNITNSTGTFGVTGSSHTGLENPADANSKALVSTFENLTAYKNRNGAIWGRGELHLFKNVKLADNANGFTHASGSFGSRAFTSQVVDSLFVGETENIGNPTTDAEKAYGRSLPKRDLPDYPIHGYEYYDYRHDIINTTFVNFQDNATRKAGAISNLFFSSFGVSTNNAMERVKFVNAKPVYFPPMEGNRKWASDNGGSTSYKTAAYKDRDGSLGGGPNSFVIIHDGVNDSIATDAQACEIKPTWNAAVCKGDVGRMNIGGNAGGGRGGAPGGGGGGARGAGAGPGGGGARGAAAGPGAAPAQGAAAGPGAAPAQGAAAGPGGPGGGGARGGAGGGRGGGAAAAPAQPPIVLSRNGKEYTVTSGNVRAGTEIKVATERPNVNLSVTELEKGSWVIFELPGFTTAASGTSQASLDALRQASDTSYFKGEGALWVKLVSAGDPGGGGPGGGTQLQVSR